MNFINSLVTYMQVLIYLFNDKLSSKQTYMYAAKRAIGVFLQNICSSLKNYLERILVYIYTTAYASRV